MDLSRILSVRSLDDVLAERVSIDLAGQTYVLPVKKMAANRAWEKTGLDEELGRLLRLVQADGDDGGALIRALSIESWRWIDLLLSYDDGDILPDRETIDRENTEMGLLIAVLEVWRAAHPLADIGLGLFALRNLMLDPEWQERMSSQQPSGDSLTGSLKLN